MQAPLIGRLLVVYFGGTSGSDSKIWDLGVYGLIKFEVSSYFYIMRLIEGNSRFWF